MMVCANKLHTYMYVLHQTMSTFQTMLMQNLLFIGLGDNVEHLNFKLKVETFFEAVPSLSSITLVYHTTRNHCGRVTIGGTTVLLCQRHFLMTGPNLPLKGEERALIEPIHQHA